VAYFKVLSSHTPGETEKYHKKFLPFTFSVRAEKCRPLCHLGILAERKVPTAAVVKAVMNLRVPLGRGPLATNCSL
jgi:hypothetical protein